MQVAVPAAVRGAGLDALLDLLAGEVNVREVAVAASDTELVRLRPKPNFRSLGRRFGKRTPEIAQACAALTSVQLRDLEEGRPATLDLGGEPVTIEPDDVVVEREVTSDWLVQSDGPYVVALDPALDDALRAEGVARELVSRVQRLRREAGYEYTTRIALWVDGDAAVLAAARAHAAEIQRETLARALHVGARAPAPDLEQAVDLDGAPVVAGMQRYDES
jgi:isoleucyl-tRNA synthetase